MIVSTKLNRPLLLGLAGGSGSGKTHFAKELYSYLGPNNCEIILQDNFYIDQSHRFDFDGGSVNFDHPDAIDFSTLASILELLKSNQRVEIPIYDFVTHKRKVERLTIEPRPVVIVDGILILHDQNVRKHFDKTIFFDTPEKLRFDRRLERDVHERGRTPEGVKNQFERQVKPMHDRFVQPSMSYAQKIIRDDQEYRETFQGLCLEWMPAL